MKSELTTKYLQDKAVKGGRLNFEEIVQLFSSSDILSLGMTARHISKKMSRSPSVITYIVDRNINYTNICSCKCRFCAFYREKGSQDAYLLSYKSIADKIKETVKAGGRQILMQGGVHPYLTIDYYEDILYRIKSDFEIHIHAFSPPEIINISNVSNISVHDVLKRLKKAGLDSIPGGGAEVLDDSIRKLISPNKCTASQWLDVMEVAHNIGLLTTATMMFGHIESAANIAKHLISIRELQDRTGGFTAFIPWSFQTHHTDLGGKASTAFDYLKILAISRIALDNISNIQASWVTQGPKIAQLSLLFGANDMGSTMLEENVVRAAGVSFSMTEHEIQRLIYDMGYIPKRRNMYYEYVENNSDSKKGDQKMERAYCYRDSK